MLRIRIVGLALVAVFAFSAVAAASASAAPEWELSGIPATEAMAVKSHGTLNLTDTKTTLGSITDTCSGKDKGTVGPGGHDLISSITNEAGTSTEIECTTKSSCASPVAHAVNLPWSTELFEEGGKVLDHVVAENGKPFGWSVTCQFIGSHTDECLTSLTITSIKNSTAGVEATFEQPLSKKAKCTQSNEETGEVTGTDINESETSEKLEVS